ncbi:hypothetical protein PV11_08669 [Exophiala sideris]|uniref:Uncharacterized protein n=1 Tax=Exophiala sideris TaxID=1016849 RepID=A0A0D1Z2X5_9EURO|nr:hypothetical protein PV11_08669 [Exophiala sideris]
MHGHGNIISGPFSIFQLERIPPCTLDSSDDFTPACSEARSEAQREFIETFGKVQQATYADDISGDAHSIRCQPQTDKEDALLVLPLRRSPALVPELIATATTSTNAGGYLVLQTDAALHY